jgi:hypothetical protein
MTPNANVAPPAQQPGWFSRNWKWFLPVGCLVPMLCCGTFGAVTYLGVSKLITESPVFKLALEKAEKNPEVATTLGTPLHAGFGVSGSLNETNGDGNADFSIPLEGPKGKGSLVVRATGRNGKWDYATLQVEAGGKTIELLNDEPIIPPNDERPDEEPPKH